MSNIFLNNILLVIYTYKYRYELRGEKEKELILPLLLLVAFPNHMFPNHIRYIESPLPACGESPLGVGFFSLN
jgi:hypothetical protein